MTLIPPNVGGAFAKSTAWDVLVPDLKLTLPAVMVYPKGGEYEATDGREILIRDADAGAVIQKAGDALTGGGLIYLTRGRYILSRTIPFGGLNFCLFFNNPIALIGEGIGKTVIIQANNINANDLVGFKDVDYQGALILADLTLDYNKAFNAATGADRGSCLNLSSAQNYIVERVELRNANDSGINAFSSMFGKIKDCHIHDCRVNGISAEDVEFTLIENNYIHDIPLSPDVQYPKGIAVQPVNKASMNRNIIIKNRFKNIGFEDIHVEKNVKSLIFGNDAPDGIFVDTFSVNNGTIVSDNL